jgi:hypothetical protein
VVEQQNTDGFSPYIRHQFPFHRLFGYQPYSPTGMALGGIAAHHRNDALFLVRVEDFGRTGTLLLIQSTIQPALLVTMAQPPNRLRREGDQLGDLRRAGAFSQLQQRQRPQDDAYLLHAAFQQFAQLLLVFFGDIDIQ